MCLIFFYCNYFNIDYNSDYNERDWKILKSKTSHTNGIWRYFVFLFLFKGINLDDISLTVTRKKVIFLVNVASMSQTIINYIDGERKSDS